MDRRGKNIFIAAIIFTIISTAIVVFFISFVIQVRASGEGDLGLAVVFGLYLMVSFIYGGLFSIVAIVLSALGIRYTKWSIVPLVLNVLYIVVPFFII